MDAASNLRVRGQFSSDSKVIVAQQGQCCRSQKLTAQP